MPAPTPVPTGTEHYDAAIGIQQQIEDIGLLMPNGEPLPKGRVYVKFSGSQRNADKPFVVVSISAQPEEVEILDDRDDEVAFACHVAVVLEKDQMLDLKEDDLKWRKQIRDTFIDKRPDDVPRLVACMTVPIILTRWVPGPIYDEELFRSSNIIESKATVLVHCQIATRPDP